MDDLSVSLYCECTALTIICGGEERKRVAGKKELLWRREHAGKGVRQMRERGTKALGLGQKKKSSNQNEGSAAL